jgi:hypothetical protein
MEATMTDKQTGGPAFPPPLDVVLMAALTPQTGALGMTLRDYFAAKAMQGLLACSEADGTNDDFARWAYKYADAMLEARDGNP